ncbi:U-box domain-containing protein 51-like [Arachis stenosperma]|uniref:U-box domain-containing protein 51-like n=1 Tax=Arachis stenosperma TaxID=217475 RepID=UPI0025AC5E8C|nr:U-box domain-containing protein 51-like [Arachis stenosperma]
MVDFRKSASAKPKNTGGPTTVIAVTSGRKSQYAVQWAVEHILKKNSSCILIHVQTNRLYHQNGVGPSHCRPPTEEEWQRIFLPFRGLCARKGIVVTELVLQGANVTSALTQYVNEYYISSVIVGASQWNSFIRKFKNTDVAASLAKSLPDFCSIYVISKGKVQTIHPAGPAQNGKFTKAATLKGVATPDYFLNNSPQHINSLVKDATLSITPSNFSPMEQSPTISFGGSSPQTDSDLEFAKSQITSSKSKKKMEEELMKLKLELKKTNEQYGFFCKEVDSAHKGVEEYEKAKLSRQRTVHAMENEENQGASSSAYIYKNIVPYRRYNIKEIEIATNYFDIDLKIGEGGYGPVFKGVIDNTDVAIKAVRPDISHGERQFNQEVQVLSTITHPNMVLLIGACPEFGCLVYEYMDYGSLEDRLFRKGNTPPIPWKIRFKIASEIATALLYLHQLKPEPLVHRDLKPANILLDRNYLSKIGDVGLARLVPPSVADKTTQYRLTKAAGTFCYIDPEYQQTGLLGVKSDIYSFGVMLLQIITAKPPMGLAHLVQSAIDAGSFEQVLDPSLNDWPVEDALSCAKLALKCCEMRKRDRPSLATVILPELNRLRDLR